jgi:hypothetical protein
MAGEHVDDGFSVNEQLIGNSINSSHLTLLLAAISVNRSGHETMKISCTQITSENLRSIGQVLDIVWCLMLKKAVPCAVLIDFCDLETNPLRKM